MLALHLILFVLSTFSNLAQSQQFYIQNWGNGADTTNYTYKSLEAGRFTVDWILGPGGNFVVGKGYRGSPNLFVVPHVKTRSHQIQVLRKKTSSLFQQNRKKGLKKQPK